MEKSSCFSQLWLPPSSLKRTKYACLVRSIVFVKSHPFSVTIADVKHEYGMLSAGLEIHPESQSHPSFMIYSPSFLKNFWLHSY